jgi:hypothetical protein
VAAEHGGHEMSEGTPPDVGIPVEQIIAQMKARRDAENKLRAFAQELFKDSPDTEAIEGWDLEALAVKHGLLMPVTVTEPCGENCFCLRYGEGFPMTCNKRTAVLTGKL